MRPWIKWLLPSGIMALLILIDGLIPAMVFFHPLKWILLIFFLFLSYLSKQITKIGFQEEQRKFPNYFFLSIILRMVFGIFFILICILLKISNPLLFLLNFIMFYFFHIVFEIYYLLGNLRANSKQSSGK
ncbi:MAG: hypothetical protein HC880_04520 [Bacteroidia bacterium]|nr:hypothetical protein [Bacteroidia bacterium]